MAKFFKRASRKASWERLAKERGVRDGKGEKPAETWPANSVPFLKEVNKLARLEADNQARLSREKLSNLVTQTIDRDTRVNELELLIGKSESELSNAKARIDTIQKELDELRPLKTELSEARGKSTVADRLDKAKKAFSTWGIDPKLPDDPQLGYNQALLNDYERIYESWYNYTNGDAKILS